MKYAFFDHQSKGRLMIRALDREFRRVSDGSPADFVFTDSDIRGRRGQLEKMRSDGARWFFAYPHSARPNLVNDIEPAWDGITAAFVATRDHRRIMLSYGYDRPLVDVGWVLCEQKPLQKRPYLRNVLFAPIHHRNAEIDKLANRDAFSRLAKLARAGEIILTVRHYMGLDTTGIERVEHERIRYVPADLVPNHEMIDTADVVVAHQTYLYLAVARGVPAVGFGTWVPCHIVPGQEVIYAPRWHEYVKQLAFPLDIAFGDPLDVLWRAIEGDPLVKGWRKRMIGKPFDAEKFIEAVKGYVCP